MESFDQGKEHAEHNCVDLSMYELDEDYRKGVDKYRGMVAGSKAKKEIEGSIMGSAVDALGGYALDQMGKSEAFNRAYDEERGIHHYDSHRRNPRDKDDSRTKRRSSDIFWDCDSSEIRESMEGSREGKGLALGCLVAALSIPALFVTLVGVSILGVGIYCTDEKPNIQTISQARVASQNEENRKKFEEYSRRQIEEHKKQLDESQAKKKVLEEELNLKREKAGLEKKLGRLDIRDLYGPRNSQNQQLDIRELYNPHKIQTKWFGNKERTTQNNIESCYKGFYAKGDAIIEWSVSSNAFYYSCNNGLTWDCREFCTIDEYGRQIKLGITNSQIIDKNCLRLYFENGSHLDSYDGGTNWKSD